MGHRLWLIHIFSISWKECICQWRRSNIWRPIRLGKSYQTLQLMHISFCNAYFRCIFGPLCIPTSFSYPSIIKTFNMSLYTKIFEINESYLCRIKSNHEWRNRKNILFEVRKIMILLSVFFLWPIDWHRQSNFSYFFLWFFVVCELFRAVIRKSEVSSRIKTMFS